jgi:hypothetical protein
VVQVRVKSAVKHGLVRAGWFVDGDFWSIAMYGGPSPTELAPVPGARIPAIGARDVRDADAGFVADPFVVPDGDRWHMFFEVWNRATAKGEIAVAESRDAITWSYRQIVLAEPHHLSYPQIIAWQGVHYMVPETSGRRRVTLYRATGYPTAWEPVGVLLEGLPFNDATLFRHGGRWWMLTETAEDVASDTLRLYTAGDLAGPWEEHPHSPVVRGDARIARPGGSVVAHDGRLIRFAQDCATDYGKRVRAFEITALTPRAYAERALGVVLEPSGSGWNGQGMHQVDAHQVGDGRWLACVDGRPVPGPVRAPAGRIPRTQRPR